MKGEQRRFGAIAGLQHVAPGATPRKRAILFEGMCHNITTLRGLEPAAAPEVLSVRADQDDGKLPPGRVAR